MTWRLLLGTPFEVRGYSSHSEYFRHQASEANWERDIPGFRERGESYQLELGAVLPKIIQPGSTVLCLGARDGSEVRAFLKCGCFAVGVDLNPSPRSSLVLTGDFHAVFWPDHCVDAVFTNSLDHSIYPGTLFSLICNLLKPSGQLIVQVVSGMDEGYTFGEMECLRWHRIQDVVDYATRFPLALRERQPMAYPWSGELICWQRNP